MREITLEELLEAGSHFGHQVTRQNPKALEFIFEARDNIHIIDLAKTKKGLEDAATFVRTTAAKAPDLAMIIVATKRQAKSVIEEELKRIFGVLPEEKAGIFWVTNRWIGGTLTNFSEVSKNSQKLKDLAEKLKDDEEKAKYTKKEIGLWEKERQKLESFYGGVKNMKGKPALLFIIDSHLENLACREAAATDVPTVAIVDTNADPSIIDYPIPANDDAVGSIKIITSYILDAWVEGKKEAKETKDVKETEETPEKVSKARRVKKTVNSKTKKESVA